MPTPWAPRAAAAPATWPVPVATSRSDVPAQTPTASSSGSATREQLIDDFKRGEGHLHDPRALELAWLAQLCWHGPLLAHELVEASDEKRERARAELAWWVERVRGALELL